MISWWTRLVGSGVDEMTSGSWSTNSVRSCCVNGGRRYAWLAIVDPLLLSLDHRKMPPDNRGDMVIKVLHQNQLYWFNMYKEFVLVCWGLIMTLTRYYRKQYEKINIFIVYSYKCKASASPAHTHLRLAVSETIIFVLLVPQISFL